MIYAGPSLWLFGALRFWRSFHVFDMPILFDRTMSNVRVVNDNADKLVTLIYLCIVEDVHLLTKTIAMISQRDFIPIDPMTEETS